MTVKLNPDGECSFEVHPSIRLDPCEVCGSSGPAYLACASAASVARRRASDDWRDKRKPLIGEVPAEAGKLVASTVFHGMLFLAFEGGLWCVMGGKLRKVTIDNA